MPKLENTFRAEISRLSRKEIKMVVAPLVKDFRSLKRSISQLTNSIQALEKASVASIQESGDVKKVERKKSFRIRFSAASVKRLRKRLGVTQREFAVILGVSLPSIAGWERGRTRPQGRNLEALHNLKKMGKREARKILADNEQSAPPETPEESS